MKANCTRLTALRALDSDELVTTRELRDAYSTMYDDFQATSANVSRLNVELAEGERARASAETRSANVPATSTRYGEALARLNSELEESQSRVLRFIVNLANEKKKKLVPSSHNLGARPKCAAMNALAAELDAVVVELHSLAGERDGRPGLVYKRRT